MLIKLKLKYKLIIFFFNIIYLFIINIKFYKLLNNASVNISYDTLLRINNNKLF